MGTARPRADEATKAATPAGDALSGHPQFTPWTDPASGVVSYVLTARVAPVQKSFYFTDPSVSADERWLSFYAASPPSRHLTRGVVSLAPARPLIRHFPGAGFSEESPMVAPEGDAAYFCLETGV